MSDGPQRLYGVPGAEAMRLTPLEVYELAIEPWLDDGHDVAGSQTIEEWSVRSPVSHLLAADAITEWLAEWVGENGEIDEGASAQWERAAKHSGVLAAAENLREVMAAQVTYRMADKLLRTLTVTWTEDGSPLLDGEPLYETKETTR